MPSRRSERPHNTKTKLDAPTIVHLKIGEENYLAEKGPDGYTGVLGIGKGTRIVEEDFRNYVKAFNVGDLGDISTSKSAPVVVRELSKNDRLYFEFCWSTMNRARVVAMAYYENTIFDKLISGD